MTGRGKPSRWAEKTLRAFDGWYNTDLFSPLGFLAPRTFWRWKWWAKFLFVIVVVPVAFLLLELLGV